MKRRGFVALLSALFTAVTKVPEIVETANAAKEEWARIWIDDVEVTEDCYHAERYSDGTGIAFCYARDAEGKFYCDPRFSYNIAKIAYKGQIRIERRPEGWRPGGIQS